MVSRKIVLLRRTNIKKNLMNKMNLNNNKIEYDLLNFSLDAFKIKCKTM